MGYIRVIVDMSAEYADRMYTYRAPGNNIPVGSRVMAPFGKKMLEGVVVAALDEPDIDEALIRNIEEPLDDEPALSPELISLAWWMKDHYRCFLADALRLMLPSRMRAGGVGALTPLFARVLDADKPFIGTRARKQAEVYTLLLKSPEGCWVSDLPGDSITALRALEGKGYIALERRERLRSPMRGAVPFADDHEPTPMQKRAIDAVSASYRTGGGAFLLHGVTGSGKTEVYIHLIRRAQAMGRSAIVLVPEIALTPQMVDWFRSRFGEAAAVLHSRLSAGERFDEWRRIRRGDARVVVGPRSALFAPFEHLGLIVMDEEHESSYISEKTPRYDTREVAQERARLSGAALVMGSATPSLECYARAQKGVYTLLELPERVNRLPMPDVSVVDMTAEFADGNKTPFSRELKELLNDCFERGEQAMLLLNRRGYSNAVTCRICGKYIKCSHCAISLTYHSTEGLLKCHYCDATQPMPTECPDCQSTFIRHMGIGTQKLEEHFQRAFPGVNCLRMDNDTTRGKDGHHKVLAAFRSGEAQALIGTQMIAKGHDFPKVTVVGLVMADLSLSAPDYRAEERTFDMIVQMAGRAGRGLMPGNVVVQTYQPEHYAIRHAARQDYRAFYHEEMNRRRRALYPPYTIVARLVATDANDKKAMGTSLALQTRVEQLLQDDVELWRQVIQVHALPCPLRLMRDEARHQVYIKLYAKGPADKVLDIIHGVSREKWPCQVTLETNVQNWM